MWPEGAELYLLAKASLSPLFIQGDKNNRFLMLVRLLLLWKAKTHVCGYINRKRHSILLKAPKWLSIVLMQVLQVRIIFQEKGPSTPCPRVTGVLKKRRNGANVWCMKDNTIIARPVWARYAKDTTSCRTFANNWLHIRTHVRFWCWRDCRRTGCFSAWTPWGWWGRWAAHRGAPSPQPASPSWPACWCSSTCSLAQVWGLFVRAVASSGLDVSLWRGWLRHRWKMALTDDRGRRSTGKLPFHSPPLSNPSGAKWMWAGTRF